ncbi:MAG: hypothetical protein R2873_04235 [Caldilineaceae bacterium]
MQSSRSLRRALVGIVLSLLVVFVVSAAGESLQRSIVGSGGGKIEAGDLVLRSAIGQPVGGKVSSGQLALYAGFLPPAQVTASPTPTSTPTATGTLPTATATSTSTPTPSSTPTATSTSTPTSTGTPPTSTPTVTGTPPTETATATATTTSSATATATATNTPTATSTPSAATPTATSTATPTATATTTPATVVVEVRNNVFSPDPIEINVGDTVTWRRIEGVHSVTADDGSFEQPAGADWITFSHTFTTAGEFAYYCTLHGTPGGGGMAGTVIVRGPSSGQETIYLPGIFRDAAMTRSRAQPAADERIYLPLLRN